MTNHEFIHSFENNAFPEGSFDHADHVRLAFAYLSQYPPLEALEKFARALKRFAAARGKTQLYNETITCAYIFLIAERIARSGDENWETFAEDNADLLVWRDGILSRYYREGTLNSELARKVFVLPDRSIEPPASRYVPVCGAVAEGGKPATDRTSAGVAPLTSG